MSTLNDALPQGSVRTEHLQNAENPHLALIAIEAGLGPNYTGLVNI